MGLIYALFDPDTNEPYYVGKTTDADRRYQRHLDPLHATRTTLRLLAEGKRPEMRMLGAYLTGGADCDTLYEQAWIARLVGRGAQLDNVALMGISTVRFASGDDDETLVIGWVTCKPGELWHE